MKVKTNLEARQHGAMEFSTAPVDLNTVREYRLGRLRKKMEEHEVAGLLLFNQINTRYAVDATICRSGALTMKPDAFLYHWTDL